MTLSRQLISLIIATFLLIFSGAFWINVENTRSYLMLQLATQTQNAADALGLSLSPHMKNKDLAAMDTMINAAFDSGYYKSLLLKNVSGKVLIERKNTATIEDVPAWFIEHLSLETPVAESVITTGWNQTGRIQLTAHPGFAYKKLWQSSLDMLRWSLPAFIAVLIAVLLILKAILRPLNAVEKQALAISKREFPVVHNIPATRELQRVVLAMNQMSKKMKGYIDTLSNRAEKMQQEARYDVLTSLLNRNGFNARLENTLSDTETEGSGALAVIRLHQFGLYNERLGHEAGNALLLHIAQILTDISNAYPRATAARITGTDFALILPLADTDAARDIATRCSDRLNQLADDEDIDDLAHIGITCFHHDESVGSILAHADAALSLAQHKGANAFAMQLTDNDILGNMAWQSMISEALQQQRVHLLAQTVVNAQQQALYSELLIRIEQADGEQISPASFASMAERLGMHAELDRYVIEQAAAQLSPGSEHRFGINISVHCIHDADFMAWMDSYFQNHQHAATRMLFEVSEYGLLQDLAASQRFIAQVHAQGSQIVMEHFGSRLNSFKLLRQLKPDYIKLDGSYIHHITDNSDNRFFLQTVADIAHGLDIQIIAEQVETADDFQTLKTLGIHAMQGYYISKPAPICSEK